MPHNGTVDQDTVDLVWAADKAHCLHYRQTMPNEATFRAVLSAMGGGNKFDPIDELGPLLGHADGVEVGMEYSAVIYITVPYYDHQRMAARRGRQPGEMGQQLADKWRIAYTERVLAVGQELEASEISVAQHPYGDGPAENKAGENPYRIHLWWD